MNSITIRIFVFAIILLSNVCSLIGQISINEYLASNTNALADAHGEFDDWIELYNNTEEPIDLAGYFLTDDPLEPMKFKISDGFSNQTIISGGGFLLIWADNDIDQGVLHSNFKLGASGEFIGIFDPGGNLIDSRIFGAQSTDVSEGRSPDGVGEYVFFNEPTPLASNETTNGEIVATEPTPSIIGGLYSETQFVSLAAPLGQSIRYTTDGSVPDENSTEYIAPVEISVNTCLRARSFVDGGEASSIMTQSYFVETEHVFAIVALTVNEDEFYGENGILENYEEDIEIIGNIEFYEPYGGQGFNQAVEIEVAGTASASAPQKSLAIKAKSSLGDATMTHPIFQDTEEEDYRSLVLRNSGNDWSVTMFRDAAVRSLISNIEDIEEHIDPIMLNDINYRPSVVYVNGKYYGIYNIRERADKRYIKTHFGLDEDEIDLLENENEVKEGDLEAWNELLNILESEDFEPELKMELIAAHVDLEEYLDYVVFQIYIDNQDWPGNNQRRFKERIPNAKWKFLLYDLDFSFGLFTSEGWNEGYAGDNSLERILEASGYNWPNPSWSGLLFQFLMEDEKWRIRFINRMADQVNVLYNSERVEARIAEFMALYAPEVAMQNGLWNNLWGQEDDAQVIVDFAFERPHFVYNHFIESLNELSDIGRIEIDAFPQGAGTVKISTVGIESDLLPWSGTYFQDIKIPIKAIPNIGYVFSHWTATDGTVIIENEIVLEEDNQNIIAHFEQASDQTDLVLINEINYNSEAIDNSGDWLEFYNPNGFEIDMSGWYFQDEEEGYFIFPSGTILLANGYLVLCEDLTEFDPVFPQLENVIGEFGDFSLYPDIKLSNGGESLYLYNGVGQLINQVSYDDEGSWPESADGFGPTLQLIPPNIENDSSYYWAAWNPTPGEANYEDQIQMSQAIFFDPIADVPNTTEQLLLIANATSGLDVEFTVVSGPATLNNNMVVLTGENGIVVVSANQVGSEDFFPAPEVIQSFEVYEPYLNEENCPSSSQTPWYNWIGRVKYNEISNSSSKSLYSDFTQLSTTIVKGETYDFEFDYEYSYFGNDVYFRMWIDYNQDEIFDVNNELAFETSLLNNPDGVNLISITESIQIPLTASSGTSKMRISLKKGDFANPCEIFEEGEVEDYTIIIEDNFSNSSISLDCPSDIILEVHSNGSQVNAYWEIPEAQTNCEQDDLIISQTQGPEQGQSLEVGSIYELEYSYSDSCNNNENCSFDLIIQYVPSVIEYHCPENITIDLMLGQNQQQINWSLPTFSSTCFLDNGDIEQVGGPQNGSILSIGNYDVVYQFEDNCGNMETCTFTIVVQGNNSDLEANCLDDQNFYVVEGVVFGTFEWDQPTGITNCEDDSIEVDQIAGPPSGSQLDVGQSYSVSYRVTDACGSENICTFSITILEQDSNLTVQCPSDILVEVPIGMESITVDWELPNVNADCVDSTVYIEQISGPSTGDSLSIGQVYNITYSIKDLCGSVVECSFVVEIAELSPSSEIFVDCPEQLIIYAAPNQTFGQFYWDTPEVSTNCVLEGLNLVNTEGPSPGSFLDVGQEYEISNYYEDACGTESHCTFVLYIQATESMLDIVCPNDMEVETLNGTVELNWELPQVLGSCSNFYALTQTDGPSFGSFQSAGIFTISYQVVDECNSTDECSFEIEVVGLNEEQEEYCVPDSDFPWYEWIKQIRIANLDHSSEKSRYSDFTDKVAHLSQGQSYDIALTNGFSYFTYDEYWQIWIDYNQNYVFEASERVLALEILHEEDGLFSYEVMSEIDVPAEALIGDTRMRVCFSRDQYYGPCEILEFGEFEDYTINITNETQNNDLTASTALLRLDMHQHINETRLRLASTSERPTDRYELWRKGLDGEFERVKTYNKFGETTTGVQELGEILQEGQFDFKALQILINGDIVESNIVTTNINETDHFLTVFPNPASKEVHLYSAHLIDKDIEVIVVDIMSKEIFYKKIKDYHGQIIEIDVSSWKPGLFQVSILTEGERAISRLISIVK